MSSIQSRRRRLAIGVAVMCQASCGQLIGADDYDVAPDSDTGTPDAAPPELDPIPILPALPDEARRPGCEECAVENCSELWQICADDPACLQMLRCKGLCSDPDCLLACDDRYPESQNYDDYNRCVMSDPCTDACGSGQNFDCAGHWRWAWDDDDLNIDLSLTVRSLEHALLNGNDRLAGAQVRVCTALSCEGDDPDYRADGVTDAAGEVTLHYWRGTANSEFGAFVEVSGSPLHDRYLHHAAPFLRDARRSVGAMNRQLDLTVPDRVALITDDTRPMVWAYASDCLMHGARDLDVRIDASAQDDQTVRAIDFHTTSAALTGSKGLVTFYNVLDAGKTVVTAFRAGEALSISQRSVFLRTDWWTVVRLYPYTRGEPRAEQ